ncbi:MAG: asparagine--tRNA ligase [archaeon]
MKFSSAQSAIEKGSGEFSLRGWVYRKRQISGKIFIVLRDATEILQCVVEKEKVSTEAWREAERISMESSFTVSGKMREDKRAPNGFELDADKLEIVHLAENFPIAKDLSEEFIMDIRHLWLRSREMNSVLRVKASLLKILRDFLEKENFVEFQAPSFVSGSVEGGATLFEVPYFGKKVYLTQSGQFYNEALITSLERVYILQPSFRAEKSKTRRHVTEFLHLEAEAAWFGLDDIIKFEERMIEYAVQKLVEKNRKEIIALGRNPEDLEKITAPFKRFTYEEVLEKAKSKFRHLHWGSDFGEKEEREITKDFDKPIVVTHYPKSLKPFYHRQDPSNPEVVLCNDILAPEGYGEIIGSGERIFDEKELVERIREAKLDPKNYAWYIDLRKYGSVPHSGFGLGVERFLTWVCKLEHIKQTIPFPRTMNRYYP